MTSNPPAFTSKPWDYRKHYCAWYYVCWGLNSEPVHTKQALFQWSPFCFEAGLLRFALSSPYIPSRSWSLNLAILLPQPLKCWNCRHASPYHTFIFASCISQVSIEKQSWQDELCTQYILYVGNIHTYELIECLNLQVVIWLSQQWLSSFGKSKNLTLFGPRGWMSQMVFNILVSKWTCQWGWGQTDKE